MKWYIKVLKQYVDFKGRASRKEFWMFVLFNLIFFIAFATVVSIIDEITKTTKSTDLFVTLYPFYLLGILIPSLAVFVRRLHDVGKSGLFGFVFFVPLIGVIMLFGYSCTKGIAGKNKYGPNPLEIEVLSKN
jgi:uncharacterized membrane protein YhaH (DUF805 family)